MQYIINHWPVFAVSAAAIISEVMPFLPTKYNGIAHVILDLLKIRKAE